MGKALKIGIIGLGKMGEALAQGLKRSSDGSSFAIEATTRTQESAEGVSKRLGIRCHTDNQTLAKSAQVVILAVKPHQAQKVLNEIAPKLRSDQLLITLCASIPTALASEWTGGKVPVLRAMPNTPALIGEGMTVFCAGPKAEKSHLEIAERVFGTVGRTAVVEESLMDGVTGLSGCGPAYVFLMIEALSEAGVKVGLSRETATLLAAQTLMGSAKMALERGEHPAALKDEVTTPAGCTIDGLMALEEGKLRVTLIKAVLAATRRSQALRTVLLIGSVLFGLIRGAEALAANASTQPPVIPEAMLSCQRDRDCAFTHLNCCGPIAAIATQNQAAWDKKREGKCRDVACPAVVDPILSTHLPGCIQGRCVARKIGDFSKSEASDCEKLEREDEKSICFQTVAVRKRDRSFCDRIPMSYMEYSQESCVAEVLSARIATGELSVAYCDELGARNKRLGEQCYSEVVRVKMDPRICLKFSEESFKQSCLSDYVPKAQKIEQCEPLAAIPNLGLGYAGNCLKSVALRSKNAAICDRILKLASPEEVYGPWFYCIAEVAVQEKNPDICRKLLDHPRPSSYSRNAFLERDCRKKVETTQ